jgi:rubrerythrin
MKLDDAIRTALQYETGVYEIYLEAMNKTANEAGKHVFKILCQEESWHLEYLRDRLIEWQETGKIKTKTLRSAIPTKEAIGGKLKQVQTTMRSRNTKQVVELELLKRALEAEIQTSNFYREMVAKLDGDGQQLFSRFLEIEDGHVAIVQAEIDNVDNWGFWFDTPEFRLEAE